MQIDLSRLSPRSTTDDVIPPTRRTQLAQSRRERCAFGIFNMKVRLFAIEEIKTRIPDALSRRPTDRAIRRNATAFHMLVLVALILLLPRVHGQRGRRRAAQLLSTRRLVLDVNRRRATPGQGEREITVRSERQLRDAAAAATDVDTRIVFVSEEIVLRSAVHIRSRGAVVLEGRGSEPTTIRCRPDGAATALFVR